MKLLDKFRAKIRPPVQLQTATNEPVDLLNESDPPIEKTTYQIPIAVGEYFPWKGHIFQISEVTPMTFSANLVGLTRRRADKLGVR